MAKATVLCLAGVLLAATAFADLQNVLVGGEIHLRGNWVISTLATPGPVQQRYTPGQVNKWAVGGPFANQGVVSIMSWDKKDPSLTLIEQRTRLNVRADFTDSVSAFIEFDSYDIWGEDFRSNYLTGVDSRAGATDTVALFQAYLQADDMFGVPLRARIGRQELSFGSEFLVGKGDKAPLFRGLSFDAVRLTYGKDSYTIDAWWAKLAERSPIEEDGDVDFYGLYGSCKAIEDWTFDAYWLYLRDARSIPDTAVNDFSVTNLHTVGLRAAGKYDAFDLEAEVAYQFGNVDQLGSTFTRGALAADDAKADVWGGRIEGGYTFDVASKPRLFAGLMYFGGEDNRGYCPYKDGGKRPKASVSFNRLFSNQIYSGFVDLNDDFSNGYVARIGVNAMPVDKLGVMLCVSYFGSIEEFVTPLIPQNCKNPKRNDGYLGTEAYLALFYQYSQDLMFEAGWAHWFGGDGSAQGQFTAWNGTMFNGGSSDADGDYIYLGSKLKF